MEEKSLLEKVRQTTRQVIEQAEFVHFHLDKLETLITNLNPAEIIARHYYPQEFHFQDSRPESDGRRLLDYIFTVTALNFGSGFSPMWKLQRGGNSTYKNIAATLKAYTEAGNSLNANWAAQVKPADLAALYAVAPDFPLMQMFAESLNQLGRFVGQEYEAEYANLLDTLPYPKVAASLVELLAANLSCFNDQTTYKGQPVYFFKRAQILSNDLYLAFNGVGFGDVPDVARLTCFADNLIPHYFRVEGVLEYEPALAGRVAKAELLEAGSPEEIEIRAAGVFCVEETVRLLNQRSDPDQHIYPAQLDNFLWNTAQDSRYKSSPRHLTHSFFY